MKVKMTLECQGLLYLVFDDHCHMSKRQDLKIYSTQEESSHENIMRDRSISLFINTSLFRTHARVNRALRHLLDH